MKWIGAVVMAIGGATLVAAGLAGSNGEPMIIAGVGLQAAGLWIWEKLRNYRDVTKEPPPVAHSSIPRDVQLERIQATLLSLQDELARVREDREFYQKLYGPESRRQIEKEVELPIP